MRYSAGYLLAAREAAGLSREQAAHRVGKTAGTLAYYESGRIAPTISMLTALANAYGCPVTDLFDPADPDDAVTRFTAELKALVDRAPPFTPAQQANLRALSRGVA
jgi:transcriptional regulator with XRE-family HTH domain